MASSERQKRKRDDSRAIISSSSASSSSLPSMRTPSSPEGLPPPLSSSNGQHDIASVMSLVESMRAEQQAAVTALRSEVRDLRSENHLLRKMMTGAWSTLQQSLSDSSICGKRPRYGQQPPPAFTSTSSLSSRLGTSKEDEDQLVAPLQ